MGVSLILRTLSYVHILRHQTRRPLQHSWSARNGWRRRIHQQGRGFSRCDLLTRCKNQRMSRKCNGCAHTSQRSLTVHGPRSGDVCISARGAKLGGIACTHDECSRWLYLARNNEHAENAMLLTALLCSRVGHRPITVFGSASDTISNVVIEPVRKIKPM